MRNYVINGGFDVLDQMSGQAIDGVGAQVAPRWWAGPGFGGALNWSIRDFDGQAPIDGNPRHFLRLEWTTAPTQGENPPSNRFTFIENHGLRDARQLHGCWVDMTWWLRVASGTVAVIPIAWSNYRDGDYAIHSGEAFPVRAERGWHPLTQSVWIPPVPAGKAIDNTSYIGFGLDFLSLYGPTIDIACVEARRKAVALNDPQFERLLATGQFW